MANVKTPSFLGELAGRLGNIALRRTRYGTQLVERNRPKDPKTPAQMEARRRMSVVGQTWRDMSVEQAALWRSYANQMATGTTELAPVPVNIFSSLALKVLQINPSAAVPLVPPVAPFGGDGVRATVSASAGAVVLNVLQGNSPGVVTEILLQPLASIHRATYLEKYRSKGFSPWVAGGSVSVPVRAGVYAVAIRVVEAATGQAGPVLELGKVVVN